MGALTDYALNIENNIYRAASLLLRKSHREGFSFAITSVSTADDEFTVSGDKRFNLRVGEQVTVTGSTGNNGTYTIESVSFDGSSTTIGVTETVSDGTADGNITLSEPMTDYYNVGQIKNAEVNFEPNLSEADSAGRQKELSMQFEITVELQQTSDNELGILDELTNSLMDVIFTAKPYGFDAKTEADVDSGLDEGSVHISEILINHSGMLNFSGGESNIPLTIPFLIKRSDISNELTT